MALSIKNPRVDRLARELAAQTGEGLTQAIMVALEERLRRVRGTTSSPSLRSELARIRKRCASLPVLDDRSPDDIVGYSDDGLPS